MNLTVVGRPTKIDFPPFPIRPSSAFCFASCKFTKMTVLFTLSHYTKVLSCILKSYIAIPVLYPLLNECYVQLISHTAIYMHTFSIWGLWILLILDNQFTPWFTPWLYLPLVTSFDYNLVMPLYKTWQKWWLIGLATGWKHTNALVL